MDSLEELLQQKNEIENSIENFAKDRDHLDANLSILFRDLKKIEEEIRTHKKRQQYKEQLEIEKIEQEKQSQALNDIIGHTIAEVEFKDEIFQIRTKENHLFSISIERAAYDDAHLKLTSEKI